MDEVKESPEPTKGAIMFRPSTKKWFGLRKVEGNFELFIANCLIEQLTMLSNICDKLDSLNEKLGAKESPAPKVSRGKATTSTKKKAKVKAKSKAKARK